MWRSSRCPGKLTRCTPSAKALRRRLHRLLQDQASILLRDVRAVIEPARLAAERTDVSIVEHAEVVAAMELRQVIFEAGELLLPADRAERTQRLRVIRHDDDHGRHAVAIVEPQQLAEVELRETLAGSVSYTHLRAHETRHDLV